MRDAVSEKRTVHADTGRLRDRVSVLAGPLLRGALFGALWLSQAGLNQATAASLFHYGARRLPMDPLFNLPYDPTQVHFESIAISSIGECAPLLGPLGHGTGQAKLFGQLQDRDSRILILGDEDPAAPRGLSGIVLVMRDGGCRISGPLLALRRTAVADPDLDPGLSPSDVSMLMRDVLTRYGRAFGGKTAFLDWADRLTSEAEEMRRERPDMPCPLLYTSMFNEPMMHVLQDFRRS
jgi:hypothetical protein